MAEEVYNAADPKHIKTRKGQEKKELLRTEDAFRFVMGDIRGRNFVWGLIAATGLYNDCFTGNSTTFHNEGKRSVGLKLIKDLETICPDEFITMWQENLTRQKVDEREDMANRTESNGHQREEF